MAMWLTARTRKYSGVLLALPSVLWLLTFFLLPLVIVFVFSFMTRDTGVTGVSLPFTFSSYERAFDVFDVILIRSVRIALYTTLICLVIGYPIAFYIRTRKTVLGRNIALFLIILPFWTNFLVRTYAWQVLLSENGTINGFLRGIGLLAQGESLQ
ncbi:MAG: ABC transporter permease, partial [Anaerolineae bacterium]|nr:ABC transporter permease [Anaerolineae bacterium]